MRHATNAAPDKSTIINYFGIAKTITNTKNKYTSSPPAIMRITLRLKMHYL
jgi:hypothetical protein